MSESKTFPFESDQIQAAPKRTRSPESIAKQKATIEAGRERLAAEKSQAENDYSLKDKIPTGLTSEPNIDLKTGLDTSDLLEMELARKLAEAEAELKDQAIPEDNRLMILQEIKVDQFNMVRRYVELTPSMCDVRNCPFDAAQKVGCAGWAEAPVDQPMADGSTFGERLIRMKEYHKATAHTVQAQNDHIITAAELHRRQWSVGNKVKGEYLT